MSMRSQVPNIFLLCWCLVLCYLFNVHLANANGLCIDKERDALLKFKAGFPNDCGLLYSWNHHNCCQWDGVHCSNHTGHVIKLILHTDESYGDTCLQGKLSSSLVDLKQLRYLELGIFDDYSTFQPIPSFIGSLSKLEYLNLSNSFFQGDIPHQLGNLSHLTVLDLSFNVIATGNLSWLSRLTFLRHINLSGVDLSKATNWLKIVNNLPFLRVLRLDSCQLPSGSIVPWPLSYINSSTTLSVLSLAENYLHDSSIFQWLYNLSGINTHLAHIDLSHNHLQGPLPTSFKYLQALSYLDLSYNNLDGTVPINFGKLQSLSFLSLSNNQFHGRIPDVGNLKNLTILNLSSNKFQVWPKTFRLMCNLQELHLNFNNLTEELSTIIQTLTGFGCVNYSLSYLDLSNNHIWGSIPSNIDAFSSLSYLNLGSNRLNGTISQSLGHLYMLEHLYLSFNSLKGSLFTNHFLNLSSLVNLDLSYNPELKFEANPPSQLLSIRLGSCKLGPSFPKWLLVQRHYMELDISSAGISDRIPKSFCNSLPPKLHSLNMSHNNFYGTLPNFHQEDTSFSMLDIDLSFNNFEGTLPSLFPEKVTSFLLNDNKFSDPTFFLCPSTSSLIHLDLSNNLLSGELPDCWINFSDLCILRLANNNISGAIPTSIGSLEQLKVLHLNNNNFSGQVPRSFDNLTYLIVLDLAYNSLSGLIQSAIGKYSKGLSILRLRNNHFVGGIPSSLCKLSFLQILDLSNNHITGSIPKCLRNITAMKNETNLLPKVRYDIIQGSIDFFSYSFGYYTEAATIMWKREESIFMNSLGLVKEIDMSNNELQGEIPDEIFSLTGLVSLDLSSNTLSGTISTKVGQLTALEVLDLSNNHLSGEIPESLANLNSLGILDLSYNNLSGEIPTGTLLQGFDTSEYEGNPNLCGMPLPKCPWDHPPPDPNPVYDNDENESDDIYHLGYQKINLQLVHLDSV